MDLEVVLREIGRGIGGTVAELALNRTPGLDRSGRHVGDAVVVRREIDGRAADFVHAGHHDRVGADVAGEFAVGHGVGLHVVVIRAEFVGADDFQAVAGTGREGIDVPDRGRIVVAVVAGFGRERVVLLGGSGGGSGVEEVVAVVLTGRFDGFVDAFFRRTAAAFFDGGSRFCVAGSFRRGLIHCGSRFRRIGRSGSSGFELRGFHFVDHHGIPFIQRKS